MMMTFVQNIHRNVLVNTKKVRRITRTKDSMVGHITRIYFDKQKVEKFDGFLGDIVWDYFTFRCDDPKLANDLSTPKEITRHLKLKGLKV